MPEIGETLREARMRQRIDMTEVEAATKIRAKYLRALETEEWELLPGSTFVKTFLRTYADYLGLDSRLLVEEYKQRFERPAGLDVAPLNLRTQRRRRRMAPSLGPGLVVVAGVVALLAALYVLGRSGQDNTPPPTRVQTPAPKRGSSSKAAQGGGQAKKPTRVSLRIVPTGPVYVCLEDAGGHAVIDKETLAAGQSTRTFHSRRFRVTFGTSNARMRVNGHTYRVATSSDPIGYELRPGRSPRRLAGGLPTCA
jgi:cytoskeleton protein RodZ